MDPNQPHHNNHNPYYYPYAPGPGPSVPPIPDGHSYPPRPLSSAHHHSWDGYTFDNTPHTYAANVGMSAEPHAMYADGEDDELYGEEELDRDEVETVREEEPSRSQSTDSVKSLGKANGSPRKKPRVTLARGGACVACR